MAQAQLYHSGSVGKETACQGRKQRFDPWIGKISWKRKWQPTPVFLLEKSHGQRSLWGLAGYSPWGVLDYCSEILAASPFCHSPVMPGLATCLALASCWAECTYWLLDFRLCHGTFFDQCDISRLEASRTLTCLLSWAHTLTCLPPPWKEIPHVAAGCSAWIPR